MSVTAGLHGPAFLGNKRFLEQEDDSGSGSRLPLAELKRPKQQQSGSPGGRCADSQAYTVGRSTIAALRALFPEMNDKVIADVLAEYGNNIDAAIKHLNDLRLSGAQLAGHHRGDSSIVTPPAEPVAHLKPQQQQHAALQQHQQQHPEQPDQPPELSKPTVPDEPGTGVQPPAPARSAAEWVDLVVRQMSEASSIDDAKQRASGILQAFEHAAVQHAKQGGNEDPGRLKLQVQELSKENQLLKRAVAIQNTRLQELGAREQEVQQLRQMLEGYQQKVQQLEVQNYSLAMHLRQATDSRDPLQTHKNPDIF